MIGLRPFQHLVTDAAYRVAREFTDYDGWTHTIGEHWIYLTHTFLPYEDGLSLYVIIDGRNRQIRMQWRPEEQGPILDALADYLKATT